MYIGFQVLDIKSMPTGNSMIQKAFCHIGEGLSVYAEGDLRIFLNGLILVADTD